jgi:transglutaminase-like putative cysteine protease
MHPDAVRFGEATGRMVERTAALFPGRARCLEQSLTLFILLRRSGVPAQLRFGAQALPFAAHAWIEVCGQAINSDAELLALLQPFPELPE